MANVSSSIKDWSSTAASNQPDAADTASLQADLQAIQAGVRYLRSQDTIASAGTTDLGTKDAESLTISGTTTITALGTVSAGIIKRCVFSGALTLTYNATSLILPGNANITTTAGDTAEFESLGSGNWRCNWYTKDNGSTVDANPLVNGITFPATQSASADANTLDDYEEGAFTPSFTNLTIGNGSVQGIYTKIGNVVEFMASVRFGTTSAWAGTCTGISGLPFTSRTLTSASTQPISGMYIDSGSGWSGVSTGVNSNSANLMQPLVVTGGAITATTPMTWTTSDELTFSGTYLTA